MSKARRNNSEPKHGSVDYVARGLARRIGEIASAIAIAAFSVSAGASWIGFIHSGTGATARTVQDKLRDHVNAKDFGVTGDGVTNDRDAIIALITAHKKVYFPAGTYIVSGGPIEVPDGDNLSFTGAGWSTKFVGSNLYGAWRLFNHDNVHISDMWIENTVAGFGVLSCFHSEISNVYIDRVKFTTNGAVLINGLKFVMDLSTTGLDGLYVNECVFDTCGGMGAEIQNLGGAAPVKYRNVHFTKCKVLRSGLAVGGGTAAGMGISFTGVGDTCSIDRCYFDECTGPSIENIGASNTDISNNWIRRAKARPIQIANVTLMTNVTVRNNKVWDIDAALGDDVFLGSMKSSAISDNIFDLRNRAGKIVQLTASTATGTGENKFHDNIVRTNAASCLLIDGCPDNAVHGNTFDNRLSGASDALVVINGAASLRNAVFANYTAKGTGGFYMSETGGATLNFASDFYSLEAGLMVIRQANGGRNGFAVFDPASIANGASLQTTVSVTGAGLGDYAMVSIDIDPTGLIVTANVSAANVITVTYTNTSGAAIDLPSHVIRARTIPQAG